MERVRRVINAKQEGIRVDRIRKAKDRKIYVGCSMQDEIEKVMEILMKSDKLNVDAGKARAHLQTLGTSRSLT